MTPDSALLTRWRDGDRAAGDELIRRHYDAVFRFFEVKARRVAPDLTQRAFLAVAERPDAFRSEGAFRAYLYGIARRLLLKHLRDSSRFDQVIRFDDVDRADSAPTPSRVVAEREEQRILLRALDELPTEQQIILQLFYWVGLRNREIGEALEIPTSTVTSRIARARDMLRQHISVMPCRERARASLQGDLDAWARSLAGAPTP